MFAPSRRCLASIVVLLGFAVTLPAATYHVAPGGDDAHPGTLEKPFRTVQHGADVLEPGDTLLLRHGTYFEKVVFAQSGTPNQRITIAGFPGEMAVIDGRWALPGGLYSVRSTRFQTLVHVAGSHVDFRDLSIRRSRARGLAIGSRPGRLEGGEASTSHVLVRNVRVDDTWDAGLGVYGTDHVIVEECEVSDAVQVIAPLRRMKLAWSVSIAIVDATNTIVRHCTAYRGHGEGIDDLRSEGTLIEDCVSYDHYKAILYLDNSRNSTVRRNFLFSTDDARFWRYGTRPTPGLVINNEPYARQNFGHGQTITNNLIYNTGTGVSIWPFNLKDSTYTDSLIAHNVFASNRPAEQSSVALGVNPVTSRNIAFRNNIVSWPAGRIGQGKTEGWTLSHNAWSEPPPPEFAGMGDVVDARLAPWPGEEWPDATVLRLAPGASPIDAGIVLAPVKADYFGTARDAEPDIGAHEFTAETGKVRPPGVEFSVGARLDVRPLAPDAKATAEERKRGFTDAELAFATRLVPESPDAAVDQPAPRTVTVKGRVFVDVSRNWQSDDDEPGLAGVFVTDGEKLVRTGEDGSYSITFEMGDERHYRFVAAVHPDGHVPLGPWFLRVPAADDQPEYRADFSFVADAGSAGKSFSFVAASDSRIGRPEEMLGAAKDFAQISGGPGAAFLVTAGELTAQGTNWQWDMYDRVREASRLPVYDGFGGPDGDAVGTSLNYEERVGPPWYSWNYGGVHFVQFVSEDAYLAPQARARQQAWLDADLETVATGVPMILISHTSLDEAGYDRFRANGHKVIAHITGVSPAAGGGDRPLLLNMPARGGTGTAWATSYRYIQVENGHMLPESRVANK